MFCFKRRLVVIILLVLCTSPSLAQHSISLQQSVPSPAKNSLENYSPSVPQLGLQFGSGIFFGSIGGVVGAFGGALIAPEREGLAGLIVLPYIATGAYLGYSVCSALGVYLVVNSGLYNASFGKILIGHGIGAATGLGSIYLMDSVDGPESVAVIFALAAPIIGGMIANSKSIKRKQKMKNASALLNITNGNTHLAPPSFQLTEVGSFDLIKKNPPTVKMLNISL